MQREKIFLSDKEIRLGGIIPKQCKSIIVFIVILASLIAITLVLDLFYQLSTIYIAKRISLIAILWPIAISDYKEYRIPNKLIIYGLIIRIALLICEFIFSFNTVLATVIYEVIAVVGASAVCFLCMLISKGSLGMGDLKLMILMGFMLGIEGICYSMFVSIFFSFVAAVILLASKKKKRKDAIPFAPFILAGTFTSIILSGV